MADARLTIGRLGLSVPTGAEIDPVPDFVWDGDRLSISGMITTASAADGAALRAQANGYGPHNPDESVIPVTWTGDPAGVDGFYTPLSVSVNANAGTYLGNAWWFPFSAELEAVPGRQAPLFELRSYGDDRDDSPVTPVAWAAHPQEAELVQFAGGGSGSLRTFTTSEGQVVFWEGPALYDESVIFMLSAAEHYESACRIETSPDNGSTYHVAVGGQIPNDIDRGFRLGNALVRVSTTSAGLLTVEHYSSGAAAWHAKTYKVVHDGVTATSMGLPASLTVLHNRPEVCSIRLAYSNTSATPYRAIYVDLTVRRGWPVLFVTMSSTNTEDLGVFRSSVEAATSFTGGLAATADDADTNKYVILVPTTGVTKGTAAGGAYLSSAGTRFTFGLANDLILTTAQLAERHFAAMRHVQRIVKR